MDEKKEQEAILSAYHSLSEDGQQNALHFIALARDCPGFTSDLDSMYERCKVKGARPNVEEITALVRKWWSIREDAAKQKTCSAVEGI